MTRADSETPPTMPPPVSVKGAAVRGVLFAVLMAAVAVATHQPLSVVWFFAGAVVMSVVYYVIPRVPCIRAQETRRLQEKAWRDADRQQRR